MITKICIKCDLDKNLSEYHKHKSLLYGFNNVCKDCRKIISKERYKTISKEYSIYHRAKNRAVKKNLEFNIEISDIIIPEECPILKKVMDIPSIDRIDPNKGYIKGNIQIISNRANMLKNNATLEEISLIYDYFKSIEIVK